MQYNKAFIFSKHTDLLPYFNAKFNGNSNLSREQYLRLRADYAVVRDVRLILLVRYEHGKAFCRIKCPVNPMPVKGEFVPSNMCSVFDFLRQHGWSHRETHDLSMFQ